MSECRRSGFGKVILGSTSGRVKARVVERSPASLSGASAAVAPGIGENRPTEERWAMEPGPSERGVTTRLIDITAPLSEELVTWPGVVERFERTTVASLDGGDAMTVSGLVLGAHAGTHVDAPNHFIAGAGGVESLPLDALIGDAHVLEIPPDATVISAAVLDSAGLPDDARRVLLKTRNSGWTASGDPFREDFVACDESAALRLLDAGVRLVGIDYLSVEPFDADERGYPVHRALLGAGVVVVESLELAGVDPGSYRLVVLPLLVPGSDGAPARAVLMT
jgi:arylformamidase